MSLLYRLFSIPINRQDFFAKCQKRKVKKIWLQPVIEKQVNREMGVVALYVFLEFTTDQPKIRFKDWADSSFELLDQTTEADTNAISRALHEVQLAKKEMKARGLLFETRPLSHRNISEKNNG